MFAEAKRTVLGNWEAFCTDCRESIGTMNGRTFNRAILFALTRGGMKCPKCRKNSCRICGIMTFGGCLCTLCKLERRIEIADAWSASD